MSTRGPARREWVCEPAAAASALAIRLAAKRVHQRTCIILAQGSKTHGVQVSTLATLDPADWPSCRDAARGELLAPSSGLRAGDAWHDHGFVFPAANGEPLNGTNALHQSTRCIPALSCSNITGASASAWRYGQPDGPSTSSARPTCSSRPEREREAVAHLRAGRRTSSLTAGSAPDRPDGS